MNETVSVNLENCKDIAQRIIDSLKGKVFSVASLYTNVPTKKEIPTVVSGLVLDSSPYNLEEGKLSIKFSPRRKLFWDLSVEQVSVTFLDDGNLIIERSFSVSTDNDPPGQRRIYRVIVVCS